MVRALLKVCGSECTVYTCLTLHILPLKVIGGAIAFQNNVDLFVLVPCYYVIKYNCSQHRSKVSVFSKNGLSYKKYRLQEHDGYFSLAQHWALFCPAFVAYPCVFTDVLDMVLGTVMHDVVQPLELHYHFRILYTEVKSMVEER